MPKEAYNSVQDWCPYYADNDNQRYHACMISDFHFGKLHTNAAYLYEFLLLTKFDTLYLNGDIFDGWKMEANKYRDFPEMQRRVIDLICKKAAEGTRVVYIPGNHDETLRELFAKNASCRVPSGISEFKDDNSRAFEFSHEGRHVQMEIRPDDIYEAVDGKRYLVMHGDQFDPEWLKSDRGIRLSKLADQIWHEIFVDNSLPIQKEIKAILARRRKDKRKFSLAKYVKGKFDSRKEVLEAFREGAVTVARERELDGVVCGHVHVAKREKVEGVKYLNSGDWDDGAGFVVFDAQGRPQVLDWKEERRYMNVPERPPTPGDKNFAEEFRPVTCQILDWVQEIWPAKNLEKLYAKDPEGSFKLYPESDLVKVQAVREDVSLSVA